MRLTRTISISITLLFIVNFSQAQTNHINDSLPLVAQEQIFLNSYYDKVAQKFSNVTGKMDRQTLKAIRKFQRQEAKLKKLLSKRDSATAANIFNGSSTHLQNLERQFSGASDIGMDKLQGGYNAYLDTLKTTFKFLENVTGKGKAASAKLKAAMGKVNLLENKFAKADAIKKYLRERKELLKQQLQRIGLGKRIKQLDKSVYYYSEYVREFKEVVKHPKRIEEKAMSLLRKSAVYKRFMAKNSLLASLFKLPGNADGTSIAPSLAGLQTRQTVSAMIASRVDNSRSNAIQAVQRQVMDGVQQLNVMKDKIIQYNGGSEEMPSFKPSEYKTKPLLKRIGLETNLQFVKTNSLMPSTADIGFGLNYKMKLGTVGIGAAYKLGLGNGWRNIRFSSNGAGLRSYLDIKIKQKLFVTGGYEQNYYNSFKSLTQLKESSAWQSSGLLGISRTIASRGKKSAKASLLWDFLSYRNHPATQPLIFRFGYTLK
jgi:hypothetical protein